MAREKRAAKPEDFVAGGKESMEAVVVRIGAHEAQLVLVDGEGKWDRWVYSSIDEAKAAGERLGIVSIHVGEYPEKTRVRMNAYRRPAADFDRGAYPEQGKVGPVTYYPENRPRSEEPQSEESPSGQS